MTPALAIAIVVTIGISAVGAAVAAASGATALIPPGRIHRLAESEQRGAAALEELASRRSRLRGASALLNVLAASASAASVTLAAEAWLSTPLWACALIGALIGPALTFSLAQALPRTFSVANPERVALESAAIVLPIVKIVSPFVRVLGSAWKWSLGVARGEEIASPWATGDEYWESSASDEDQERAETEEALLEAVSDFGEKVVREVMVPRTDMAALPETASATEAVQMVRATGYSRLPVFKETVDNVSGVLYAKDLLTALDRGGESDIARIARPAYFIPETKPLDQLLVEMRSRRTHIAIVADEYGGTAGLVTIEDLLEEIVGEIFDEYDLEISLIEELGDGRVQVDARLPLDDLNERFDTAIEFEAADTVGGLFTALAGHIPEPGEHVDIEGLRLTVADLDGNRIRHVIVETAPAAENGSEHA